MSMPSSHRLQTLESHASKRENLIGTHLYHLSPFRHWCLLPHPLPRLLPLRRPVRHRHHLQPPCHQRLPPHHRIQALHPHPFINLIRSSISSLHSIKDVLKALFDVTLYPLNHPRLKDT
ncbi:hypothetical protein ACLOJK_034690 [Asimina triloba]